MLSARHRTTHLPLLGRGRSSKKTPALSMKGSLGISSRRQQQILSQGGSGYLSGLRARAHGGGYIAPACAPRPRGGTAPPSERGSILMRSGACACPGCAASSGQSPLPAGNGLFAVGNQASSAEPQLARCSGLAGGISRAVPAGLGIERSILGGRKTGPFGDFRPFQACQNFPCC